MECNCCGAFYQKPKGKPQDPDRDTGFGWCFGCKPHAIKDWTKYSSLTLEQAEARWSKYHPDSAAWIFNDAREAIEYSKQKGRMTFAVLNDQNRDVLQYECWEWLNHATKPGACYWSGNKPGTNDFVWSVSTSTPTAEDA